MVEVDLWKEHRSLALDSLWMRLHEADMLEEEHDWDRTLCNLVELHGTHAMKYTYLAEKMLPSHNLECQIDRMRIDFATVALSGPVSVVVPSTRLNSAPTSNHENCCEIIHPMIPLGARLLLILLTA